MKRILTLALLLLMSTPAWAQQPREIYRFGASQSLSYTATTPTKFANGFDPQTRWVRVVAMNASAYLAVVPSGGTANPTAATGVFMPVSEPTNMIVPGNGNIYVIGVNGSGSLFVTELD